jgi:excinuclease ABC subunit A
MGTATDISSNPTRSSIRIRGARVNNLRGVDIDIPHGEITVITGVSGSGKSSLAFDTLFAEGQRQYIESLSAYARQFLDQIPRPDVDHVDGLQPTLCIDQKAGVTHPRSTVATVTEIYDYLRLLFARVGTPHCTGCGTAISQQSADQIIETLRRFDPETKLVLLAPMVRGRRGTHREVFDQIRASGWLRARVDGEIHSLDELPELAPRKLHTIDAVVDRLVMRPDNENRLIESAQTALRAGGGVMTVLSMAGGQSGWREQLLSTLYACPGCGKSFQELEPRTFSFNSPYGACPTCDGLGIAAGAICRDCGGGRLRPEALAVTLADRNIASVTAMAIGDSIEWFESIGSRLGGRDGQVAQTVTAEISQRLRFLDSVGLHYLTLDRPATTLSGGELQRVRLATSLGSGLVGVCYVLDEPSIGLHPSDNDRLIESIRDLRRMGNTVVVVEHDEAMMRAADRLIDVGPGAGPDGGMIISQGTPDEVACDPASITGPYLAHTMTVPYPETRRPPRDDRWVKITGVTTNNLKGIDARFPLGLLVGVTGVSGSGKSSLVNDTLVPAIEAVIGKTMLGGSTRESSEPEGDETLMSPTGTFARFDSLIGAEMIDKVIRIDQRPIGRGPRSCPATYCGVLDEIRKVFAATREAKQRGFQSNRFSFNATTGRCDVCKGQGLQKIEMNFLSDLFVVCPRCNGKRYNRQTLMVRFKGHSIADVLEMTIDQAADFFENFPKIHPLLSSLRDIGLGYLRLGQPSTTLSGGEAQRIKLGTELARPQRGHTFYVLDEPTTGLHFVDVARLLAVLRRLVDADHTVVVIEHNREVIRACDWLLDIGPTGGRDGGYLIGEGTPETIAGIGESLTGRYLSPMTV